MKKNIFIIMMCMSSLPVFAETYTTLQYEQYNRSGVFYDVSASNFPQHRFIGQVGVSGYHSLFSYDISYDRQEDFQSKNASKTKVKTVRINSLYRDFDMSDTVSIRVGKFVEDWQIGYFFMPLALVNPYTDNASVENPLGFQKGMVATKLTYADDIQSLTFYSSRGSKESDLLKRFDNTTVAIKYARPVSDDTDITIITHKQNNSRWGVGIGLRNIMSDSTKLYGAIFSRKGSVRVKHKGVYDMNAKFIAQSNPMDRHALFDNTITSYGVIGIEHTFLGGTSILGEISMNQQGMNTSQWNSYREMVANHAQISGANKALVVPNLKWDMALNNPHGLRQIYTGVRISKTYEELALSGIIRSGVDASGLLIADIQYQGYDKATFGVKVEKSYGGEGTEFGTYFPYDKKILAYMRVDF